MAITTVLLDLDGVIRHFDPAHVEAVETSHGLPLGTLTAAAFEPELLQMVVTGRMRRSDWTKEVGRRVSNPDAALEWMANIGSVDQTMLGEVDGLRRRGMVVAVLTNGTDTIPQEMETLGLADRFDRIFSTSEIGYAKPDPLAFEHVCAELGVAPGNAFFTDDSPAKLQGAIEIGMIARVFEGVQSFRLHLRDLGLTDS